MTLGGMAQRNARPPSPHEGRPGGWKIHRAQVNMQCQARGGLLMRDAGSSPADARTGGWHLGPGGGGSGPTCNPPPPRWYRELGEGARARKGAEEGGGTSMGSGEAKPKHSFRLRGILALHSARFAYCFLLPSFAVGVLGTVPTWLRDV